MEAGSYAKMEFPKGQGEWPQTMDESDTVGVSGRGVNHYFLPYLAWTNHPKKIRQWRDVATGVIYEQDFFADYRRKRESWRSDEGDLYRSIINDGPIWMLRTKVRPLQIMIYIFAVAN